MGDLTKNFSRAEFASPDGVPVPAEYEANLLELAQQLQVLRDRAGKPISIHSAYRSPAHNKAVGGVPSSRHTTAQAADFDIQGETPANAYCRVENLIGGRKMKQGGLGIYATHVHYDTRGSEARWSKGAPVPDCPPAAQNGTDRNISAAGLAFIAKWEGFVPRLYNDAVGHCTVGIGHLVHRGNCDGRASEQPYRNGISYADAIALKKRDAVRFVAAVNDGVTVPLNQNQFDALVSFAFNLGVGVIGTASFIRQLNQGNYAAVPPGLMLYNKAGDPPRVLEGLTNRRQAEADLWNTPEQEEDEMTPEEMLDAMLRLKVPIIPRTPGGTVRKVPLRNLLHLAWYGSHRAVYTEMWIGDAIGNQRLQKPLQRAWLGWEQLQRLTSTVGRLRAALKAHADSPHADGDAGSADLSAVADLIGELEDGLRAIGEEGGGEPEGGQ